MSSIRKSKIFNENTQARDKGSGRFRNIWGLTIHSSFSEDSKDFIDLRKRPGIKNDYYKALIAKRIIDHETKYISSSCFNALNNLNGNNNNNNNNNNIDSNNNSNNDNNNNSKNDEPEYDEEDHMVEDNKELTTKCIHLRKEIRESVISDIKNIDFVPELKDFHTINWLTNRPRALCHPFFEVSLILISIR